MLTTATVKLMVLCTFSTTAPIQTADCTVNTTGLNHPIAALIASGLHQAAPIKVHTSASGRFTVITPHSLTFIRATQLPPDDCEAYGDSWASLAANREYICL